MKKTILLLTVIGSLCFFSKILNAQTPIWNWAKSAFGTIGAAGVNNTNSISVDASGNTYVAGYFGSPTLTIGSTTLTNADTTPIWDSDDIFFAKFDPNGDLIWAKRIGGSHDDIATSIATDASGNTYITGYFYSPTITFGSTTLTNVGNCNIFLAKLDVNGNVLWAKRAGGTGYDYAYSVAIGASGNIYFTGRFESPTITFGSTILTKTGNSNIFLVKYNTSGDVLWAKSAGNGTPNSLAVDVFENIYITGIFAGSTITFGFNTLTNIGCDDIFLAKYNTNGNVLWAKSAGGTNIDEASSIAVDVFGNAFITGWYWSSDLTFGSTTLTNIYGNTNIFLAKYNSNGNVLWAKSSVGGIYTEDKAHSVVIDSSGNAFVAGSFESSTINFGSISLANTFSGSTILDIFITKYDSCGNALWAKKAEGMGEDAANCIVLDASNNVYAAGYFRSSSLTFDFQTLTNVSTEYDLFFTKLGNSATGINFFNNKLDFSIFPNPANVNINIIVPQKSTIEILNIQGQTIIQQQIQQGKTDIDISKLAKGVYILRLNSNNKTAVTRIVKE